MASTFSLDDIKKAAEKKYGSTEIDLGDEGKVSLVNVMRLPKERRDALLKIQDGMKEDGADQEGGLKAILRLVAATEKQADKLLDAAGDDLAVLVTIFERYSAGTELGEASASQS